MNVAIEKRHLEGLKSQVEFRVKRRKKHIRSESVDLILDEQELKSIDKKIKELEDETNQV